MNCMQTIIGAGQKWLKCLAVRLQLVAIISNLFISPQKQGMIYKHGLMQLEMLKANLIKLYQNKK